MTLHRHSARVCLAAAILLGLGVLFGRVGPLFAAEPLDETALRDGDLIFHTSKGPQAPAILLATGSPFTHMGLIRKTPREVLVIEAGPGPVHETPLQRWLARGLGGQAAVYRYRDLDATRENKIVEAARAFLGRGYDIMFSFRNREIYCSELPYLAFRSVGLPLGEVQKISTLNIDNIFVRRLAQSRWAKHPACAGQASFEACMKTLGDEELVTPASIAADPRLTQIYSNY